MRRILRAGAYGNKEYYDKMLIEKPLIGIPPQLDKISGMQISKLLTYWIPQELTDKYYNKNILNTQGIDAIIKNCIDAENLILQDDYEMFNKGRPINEFTEDKNRIYHKYAYIFSIISKNEIIDISTTKFSSNTILDKNKNKSDVFEIKLEINGKFAKDRTNYIRKILDICKYNNLLLIDHKIEDVENESYLDDAIRSKAMEGYLKSLKNAYLDEKLPILPIKVIHEE